jgi:hypothetical protein
MVKNDFNRTKNGIFRQKITLFYATLFHYNSSII